MAERQPEGQPVARPEQETSFNDPVPGGAGKEDGFALLTEEMAAARPETDSRTVVNGMSLQ